MCTATYLPNPAGGYWLTHSRDEALSRPAAIGPKVYGESPKPLIYPKDPLGGGTWIVTTGQISICLLNGAFTAHQPCPPYRFSRGLIPLQVAQAPSLDAFLDTFNPCGLEPFTLLIAQLNRLVEVRWDGQHLYVSEKDPLLPHLWSSATLYTAAVQTRRQEWFRQWLTQGSRLSQAVIHQMHRVGGPPDEPFRMVRPGGPQTLGITGIAHTPEGTNMRYDDLITTRSSQVTLPTHAYATRISFESTIY